MNWKLIRIIDACIGIPLIWCFRSLALFRHREPFSLNNSTAGQILLIKFWGIGNLFMLLPTIQAIRSTWPGATIDFLTLENNREALAMTGAVDDIVTLDTRSPGLFLRTWRLATTLLRYNHYDLIVDFEQFARFSALLTHQIGAGQTIGFETRGQHRHHLYTRAIDYDNDIHITRSFYALAMGAGVATLFSPEVQLSPLKMLRDTGRRFLVKLGIPPEEPVVVMHIGTSDNFLERRWPPERYAALADLLTGQYGIRVILTGLPEEAFLTRETWQRLKKPERVIDLGGQMPFTDYFALITVSDLVISADTAAVHLASAVNTPVIGLYGPNSPHLYGPWGRNGLALFAGYDCSPCITNFNAKINTCRHPDGRGACMLALTVEDTFAAIEGAYCATQAPFRLTKLGGSDA